MTTILVSGASGIVGYGILRSLRKSERAIRLIGTTIFEDSVAQGFCDVFVKAPPTHDANYLDWLLDVIREQRVDLIIPGIEIDVYKWIEHVPEIESCGAKAVLNDGALTALCEDKWLFYEHLKEHHSAYAIPSSIENNFDRLVNEWGLPFLLKPRRGYGGRGIIRVETRDIFLKHQQDMASTLMAQPIIGSDDQEFTTSAFCDGNGGVFASMTLKRTLSSEGYTDKAEVVDEEGIEAALHSLCKLLNPIGPTNFQFRKQENDLKLLEINPRVSSATSIRTAFGYNECDMAVAYFLENKTPTQPQIKQGRAVRYTEDFIFYENGNNI